MDHVFNVGCKLKCMSKRWTTKKAERCPAKGAVALRQEARFRQKGRGVDERDSKIFEQQRKLNPDFVPHARASVECNGRWYFVCKNTGCQMRVLQKSWGSNRMQSCKGTVPVVAEPTVKKVDPRGRKRATRRSGDPDVPI